HACEDDPAASPHVPAPFWPAQPARALGGASAGEPILLVSGAVVVRVRGRRALASGAGREATDDAAARAPALSPELAAALAEAPPRPLRELWRVLRRDGALAPAVVLAALGAASAG